MNENTVPLREAVDTWTAQGTMSKEVAAFIVRHFAALEAKLEALEDEIERYQEKADAVHKYLAAKDTSALIAVVTELSLDAERRAAQEEPSNE